jgi:hypothetical protein
MILPTLQRDVSQVPGWQTNQSCTTLFSDLPTLPGS